MKGKEKLRIISVQNGDFEKEMSSGGARVFAARGKRLYCRPTNQIKLFDLIGRAAIQTVVQSVYFMISDIGGVNQLLGSPPFSSPLLLPPLLLYPFPSPPLKVQNLAKRCKLHHWGLEYSPSRN